MSALLDLATIRSNHSLPSVVGASVKLRRQSGGWIGSCPFHNDRTPSFTVFDADERYHCFGCGAHGDVFDFVQQMHGVDLREAAEMITGERLPVIAARSLPAEAPRDTTEDARKIWRSAGPIAGTPAEAYLRSRGIHCPLPESLRYARLRYQGVPKLLPCLVALVASPDSKVSGIQRTFVREDGSGKASVPAAKLSLGRISGGAVRLAPVAAEMVVTGGIEDGLTLQQELGRAVWAATGEGNMANMVLPPIVKSVTIGADGDENGALHASRAAERLAEQGREVRIIRPLKGFKDFNEELQGELS